MTMSTIVWSNSHWDAARCFTAISTPIVWFITTEGCRFHRATNRLIGWVDRKNEDIRYYHWPNRGVTISKGSGRQLWEKDLIQGERPVWRWRQLRRKCFESYWEYLPSTRHLSKSCVTFGPSPIQPRSSGNSHAFERSIATTKLLTDQQMIRDLVFSILNFRSRTKAWFNDNDVSIEEFLSLSSEVIKDTCYEKDGFRHAMFN